MTETSVICPPGSDSKLPRLNDSAVLPNDPEVLARAMQACHDYLLRAAREEMHPGCKSKGEASDIVQETYVDTCKHLPRFIGQSVGDLKRFMRKVLRNNVVNFTRYHVLTGKRSIKREVSLGGEGSRPGPIDALTTSNPSPSGVMMKEELVERIAWCMATLNEEERQLIQWRNEKRKWPEIGRLLKGVGPDAARKRHERAKEKLQEVVRQVLGDDSIVF